MKKYFLVIAAIFIVQTSFSQTKLIAHRSHSGSIHTFNNLAEGNFGVIIRRKPDSAELKRKDSLKTLQQLPYTFKEQLGRKLGLLAVASK